MAEKLIRNEKEAIKTIKLNYPTSGYYMLREALDMAISALEKQIPKKPNRIVDGHGIRYTDSYRCQNCGKGFSGTGIAEFCYHCGQKLDWSDARQGSVLYKRRKERKVTWGD